MAATARARARDEFHPDVTGHRMLMQHRIAEMQAASRLAEIRRQLALEAAPAPAPAVVVQGPAPVPPSWYYQHWYWDESAGSWSSHPPASWSAPAPAPVRWQPRRRSIFGWFRLLWVGSWLVLFAYGLLVAALVELVEAVQG